MMLVGNGSLEGGEDLRIKGSTALSKLQEDDISTFTAPGTLFPCFSFRVFEVLMRPWYRLFSYLILRTFQIWDYSDMGDAQAVGVLSQEPPAV